MIGACTFLKVSSSYTVPKKSPGMAVKGIVKGNQFIQIATQYKDR